MRIESLSIRKSLYYGLIGGAYVWTVYAIVECLFSNVLRWVITPSYAYVTINRVFLVLLFIIYPFIGAIFTGLFVLILRVIFKKVKLRPDLDTKLLFSNIATFMIILIFNANLIICTSRFSSKLHILPTMFISLLLIFSLVANSYSDILYKRLSFLTNPWTIMILLLGLSWNTLELLVDNNIIVKAIVALTFPVVIFSFSFLIHKLVELRQIKKSQSGFISPRNHIFFLVTTALIVLSISLMVGQAPRLIINNSKQSLTDIVCPNIVLITMDTVRADHLSLYGYERNTTPNLKEFAKNATLYSHAIAAADMTLPTHASIFTGLYAREHGAHFDTSDRPLWRPLAKKFHTLAEILSENGYLTMGVVSNGVLSPAFGFEQGFQYYDPRESAGFLRSKLPYCLMQGVRNILTSFSPTVVFDSGTRRAEEINREVFMLLDKVQKSKKLFFIFINYMDAHWAYDPPRPFDTRYPGKDEKFHEAQWNSLQREVMGLKRKIKDKERDHLMSQYDGEIAYLDFHLKKLFIKLKTLGLYENCIIIITSDHGEAFGERDLVNHSVSVYQDQVHIPLIIKYPNDNKGMVVHKPVSSIDLMPTILSLTGLDIPGNIQGHNLLKLDSEIKRTVISESFKNEDFLSWHSRFDRIERAIFSWPFKFITSTAGKKELYNLSDDKNEKKNIYYAMDSISKKLESQLRAWVDNTKEESGSPVLLDKDARKRLKALGYIQ